MWESQYHHQLNRYDGRSRFTRDLVPQRGVRLDSCPSLRLDHVLLDVPPIAANQAVAAVNAADRITVVTPASDRGTEAVQRCHERLADVGTEASLVVSTRGDLATADVAVPTTSATAIEAAPACLDGEDAFTDAIRRVAAAVAGKEITDADAGGDGLLGSVGGLVDR
mgnify:CR=1 FL=1